MNKFFILFPTLLLFFVPVFIVAQNVTDPNELINKIEEHNIQIKHLEEEINLYNQEIESANKQATTLQKVLKSLDLTKKKIGTDINLTEKKINKTNLTIEQLGLEINKTEESIEVSKKAIINAIREIYALEEINLVEIILLNKNISEIWNDIDNIKETRDVIRDRSKELSSLKLEMEQKQSDLRGQKNNLVSLKQDLGGKKEAVIYTEKEKQNLLQETKNKEETYKELVKTKEELKAQFEKELYEYETQLNLIVDKDKYPEPRHGILSWPLDNVYITQRFGRTIAAKTLYLSGSHNGVDFRAGVGTRIKSALEGTVVGVGNTDLYPGCYSFGKWVMVKHDNGLSTIYAHLSVISVSNGQRIETGGLIGYSGNTGYTTGPHLHVGLYATQGVRIEKYVNSRGCKQVTMPLADIKAYLDPLAYFPEN